MTDRTGPTARKTAAETSAAATPAGETATASTSATEESAATSTASATPKSRSGAVSSAGTVSAESVAAELSAPATSAAETEALAGAGRGTAEPDGPAGPESAAAGPARQEAAEPEAPAVAVAASAPEGDGPTPGDTAAASVGRPGRPLLAGAAVLGALLIAVPGLLMSRGDRTPENHDRVVADQAGTILGDGATQGTGAYASSDPSAPAQSGTPKIAQPHKSSPGKTSVAQPVSGPTTVKTKKPAAAAKPTKKSTTTKSGTKSGTSGSTTTSSYPSDVLVTATRVLSAGQSINAKKARLRMQTDGNFVLYDENNKPRWATMTFGSNYHAVFQADGNLVVYTASNQPVWASQTGGHDGSILRLQGDGNMVIYSGGSTAIWASNTQH
ncbi:hypothetical protein [Streptomyces sp. NPDC050548]|uniref:hypothetical protein n=1 Tax=Streptomyces sp. NPDC050548 TaxID=3365629 RepID=UPI0037A685D9